MSLAIDAFVDNVKRFCDWAESDCHGLDTARHVLLALMQGVSSLPIGGAYSSIATEYERRGYEQRTNDFKRFADVPVSYYRTLLEPLNIDSEESAIGDVHDDLADVYGDLWHGLQAHNSGDMEYAVAYWRSSYDNHWGAHAAGAFSAIDPTVDPKTRRTKRSTQAADNALAYINSERVGWVTTSVRRQ